MVREKISPAEPIRKEGSSSGRFTLRPVPGSGEIVTDAAGPFGNSAARYAEATASLGGGGSAPGPRRGWI